MPCPLPLWYVRPVTPGANGFADGKPVRSKTMAEAVYRDTPRMPRIDPAWDLPTEAELPCDDGNPLPESDFQLDPLVYAFHGLRWHYAERRDVAVHADMFVHYLAVGDDGQPLLDKRGKPVIRRVAPDVFVSFGAAQRMRHSYVAWDEGKLPDFVLEVLSTSTWRHDIGAKKEIYERLGVREYWVLDPYGAFLEPPPIKGNRLVGKRYVPIPPLPGDAVAFRSDVLGLDLRMAGDVFRIRDPATGADLPDLTEMYAAYQREERARVAAEAALAAAEARRDAAEAALEAAARRTAELEAQLARKTR